MVAASQTSVSAVVSLSAPSAFEAMNAVDSVRTVTVPTWLAVGKSDDARYVDGTREIYAASGSSHKQLHVLATGGHGIDLLSGATAMIAIPRDVRPARLRSQS